MAVLKTCYVAACVAGLILSCYAVYIERAKMADENYEALCDINEALSCTSVLTSEYSIGLGVVSSLLGEDSILNIPSAYYGVILYAVLILLSLSNSKAVIYFQLFLNIASMMGSIFLAYILIYVIEKTCIVCYGIHLVNTLLVVMISLRICCAGSKNNISKKKKKN